MITVTSLTVCERSRLPRAGTTVQAKSLKPTEVRVLVKVSIALQQKVDMLGVQSRGGQGKQLNLTRLACPRLMVMNA